MSVRGATAEGEPTAGSRVAELFFMAKAPAVIQATVALVSVLLAIVTGLGLDRLHRHYAGLVGSGDPLNPLAALLASGSSAATAWTGWAAALFFAVSLHRLRTGPPEPPAGRGDTDAMSVNDIRSALRAEYSSVRVALAVVSGVALIDLTRCVVFILSPAGAPSATLWATVAEAVGIAVAAGLLGVWAWSFRSELERWGAV